MPRDKTRTIGLFDKKRAAPANDVRSDTVLHRIQDRRMMRNRIRPGEQQMRFMSPITLQGFACLCFMCL